MLLGVGGAERLLISAKAAGAPRTATARTRSPSATINSPNAASQRCIAFSSRISKTGARSPGEELMTCNTSAVAVCCSNASRVSVRSRAFSIAMTACAAKFCSSDLVVRERPYLTPKGSDMADQRGVLAERHKQQGAEAGLDGCSHSRARRVAGGDVRDVD